jgi:SAM-dependent methyltransferase
VLRRLDLGCRFGPGRDAVGVCPEALHPGSVRADLARGLPFQDDSIDEVYAYHVLEYAEEFAPVMEEIWRVAKPNAMIYLRVPHASSVFGDAVDVRRRRGFTIQTFRYYTPTAPRPFSDTTAQFEIELARLYFVAPWEEQGRRPRFAKLLLRNFVEGLANRSPGAQFLCERWWARIVGFEEAFIALRTVKPDTRSLLAQVRTS